MWCERNGIASLRTAPELGYTASPARGAGGSLLSSKRFLPKPHDAGVWAEKAGFCRRGYHHQQRRQPWKGWKDRGAAIQDFAVPKVFTNNPPPKKKKIVKRNGTSSPAQSTRLWSPSHTARPTAGDGIGSHKRQWKTMGRPTGAEGCFMGWPGRVSRRVTELKHPRPLIPAVVEHRSHPFPIPRAGAGAAAPATPGPGPAAWPRPEGGSWGTHSSGSRCGTPEGGG